MKNIVYIVLLIVLVFIGQSLLPWWVMVLITGLVGFGANLGGTKSFLIGFVAILLLWQGYAFILNMSNEGLIGSRLSRLLLGIDNPTYLLCITGLMAGIVGGLGMLTGYHGRKIFSEE